MPVVWLFIFSCCSKNSAETHSSFTYFGTGTTDTYLRGHVLYGLLTVEASRAGHPYSGCPQACRWMSQDDLCWPPLAPCCLLSILQPASSLPNSLSDPPHAAHQTWGAVKAPCPHPRPGCHCALTLPTTPVLLSQRAPENVAMPSCRGHPHPAAGQPYPASSSYPVSWEEASFTGKSPLSMAPGKHPGYSPSEHILSLSPCPSMAGGHYSVDAFPELHITPQEVLK